MSKNIFSILRVFFLFVFLSSFIVSAQDKSRGNFIRTEIRKTEKREQFSCALSSNSDSIPCLLFTRQILVTYFEVPIYETLERIMLERDDKAPKGPGSYHYRLIPGELWEGELTQREELQDAGVFSEENFVVNGVLLKTDKEAKIYADQKSELGILEFFDNINKRRMELEIEHASLGSKTIEIYRIMPRQTQSDDRKADETADSDILCAMNIDFYQRSFEPERNKLKVEYFISTDEIKAGSTFSIMFKITNNGTTETSCLLGRSFSREAWLNGKLYYFGAIEAGKSKIFNRVFSADEILKTKNCYMLFALSDSWGELPKHSVNLILPVK